MMNRFAFQLLRLRYLWNVVMHMMHLRICLDEVRLFVLHHLICTSVVELVLDVVLDAVEVARDLTVDMLLYALSHCCRFRASSSSKCLLFLAHLLHHVSYHRVVFLPYPNFLLKYVLTPLSFCLQLLVYCHR